MQHRLQFLRLALPVVYQTHTMSSKKSTMHGKSKPKSKLGTFEENWLENSLQKSYTASGQGVLGVQSDNEASAEAKGAEGGKEERVRGASALDMFGISREALAEVGMADRTAQDRLYRTLTIWSSTLYDSLYSIANGKRDVQGRIWQVYTRLVEICNPETSSLVAVELRREFEGKLCTLSASLKSSEEAREQEARELRQRLIAMESEHEALATTAHKEVPRLRAELHAASTQVAVLEEHALQREAQLQEQARAMLVLEAAAAASASEVAPLQHQVKVLHDELLESNTEIQRYIDMYLEADRVVRKNESDANMAVGEKERLVTKMATLLKQSAEKDTEVARVKGLVGEAKQEAEALRLQVAEAEEAVRTAALQLHQVASKAKGTQEVQTAQIKSLQETVQSLQRQVSGTDTLLASSRGSIGLLHCRATAAETVSVLWQTEFAQETGRVEEQQQSRLRQSDELLAVMEENARLEEVVAEQAKRLAQVEDLKLDEQLAVLQQALTQAQAERDAALAQYAPVKQIEENSAKLTTAVAMLGARHEELERQYTEQSHALRIAENTATKAEGGVAQCNDCIMTLLSLLSLLRDEVSAQLTGIEAANAALATQEQVLVPKAGFAAATIRKRLAPDADFQRSVVLSAGDKFTVSDLLEACLGQRAAMSNVLQAADQVQPLQLKIAELTAELASMKAWSGKERIRKQTLVDQTQLKARLEVAAKNEEIRQLESAARKNAEDMAALKEQGRRTILRMEPLQAYWNENRVMTPEPEPEQEEVESDTIDFSQFDDDDEEEAAPQEVRMPSLPEDEKPSNHASNPRHQ